MEAESKVDLTENKADKAEDSSIQCKEEKITETKNIEGESKFSNKNENVESEKSTLADTQCATNTSPNISSQEIMNEKDAKNDVTDLNKIDTNDEQKIKTNSNVTAAETTDVENRQFGDSAETESAKSPVDQNNDGDVESDDDLDEEDEDEDDDDDEKMDDPYTFSDDEKETISPPNPTIPGSTPPISSSSVKYSSTTMSSSDNSAMIKENCNDFSPDVNKQLTAGNKQTNLLRLNHDSTTSDDLDGDDEDRLVIADEDAEAIGASGANIDSKRDPISLKENVLNLKSDKPRKKHLRFNGMSEEEVAKRQLPDLLKEDLDILIIGINPGLYAAFKGHHYAGPGNHFWKCMFLGGLTPKSMCADDDFKLLEYGIGFTNVVMRPTRGSANLTRKEIEEGSHALIEKLKTYKPRIAVFNGKGIYEIFSGKKEFHFGKQPEKVEGTETYAWVMPNSSARCAQLPRAVDKVPFYKALTKYRDYLKGDIPDIDEAEVVFSDIKLKTFNEKVPEFAKMNSEFKISDSSDPNADLDVSVSFTDLEVRVDPDTGKKRRGRPPKPRADGTLPPPKRRVILGADGRPMPRGSNPIDPTTGKKKRGRPKKADMLAAQAAFEAEHGIKPSEHKMSNMKRDSLDSSDEFGVIGNGNGDDLDHNNKVVEGNTIVSSQPQLNQPVRPLPPFSPNFGTRLPKFGEIANGNNDESSMDDMKVDESEVNGNDPQHHGDHPQAEDAVRQRLFNEAVQQQQHAEAPPPQQQQPQAPMPHEHSVPPQQYFGGNGSGPGGHTPTAPPNTFSPNFNYGNGSPLHSGGFDRVKGGPSPSHMGPQRNSSGADDVTTKSISGLESLVDQIPAIAENDSGVFSGSGAGSHPNTPRSVGPYSPAAGGPGSFHTSPFHTPTASNHFNPADGLNAGPGPPIPGGGAGGPPGAGGPTNETSTNYHPPTDFSVNSLVHPARSSEVAAAAAAAAAAACQQQQQQASPVAAFTASDSSFSVSSLTSSYANDVAAKYANPYASAYAASAAAGFPPAGFNSFMGAAAAGSMAAAAGAGPPMTPMTPMGAMSYYGQYSNTYAGAAAAAGSASAAAAASFGAPNPYYMPNHPGYPYSHYGQYSQSPYF